jgi:hypothetical protein
LVIDFHYTSERSVIMIRLRANDATKIPVRPGAGRPRTRMQAHALRSWRLAAGLVWTRWEILAEAPRERRSLAWAAYITALDDEASAAAVLAETQLGRPA